MTQSVGCMFCWSVGQLFGGSVCHNFLTASYNECSSLLVVKVVSTVGGVALGSNPMFRCECWKSNKCFGLPRGRFTAKICITNRNIIRQDLLWPQLRKM